MTKQSRKLCILHQVNNCSRKVLVIGADKHATDMLDGQIAKLKENKQGLNEWVRMLPCHLVSPELTYDN